ncbi:hypothetical protein PHYBLDRAFT_142999 [Phycomyces blakesleeanus NRRL 1555(-)]|uniref:F-box domain-containing protein n=1 Tax=Phycomyces blakesleeanus (strain ATCC 8743b / DSM 1359 / FGSC 10004 / NBRC 33097 / NRRL 1555) TaxID=763407 RepID=A0A163AV19_PHYB8|nr:hypothetical protein PHYBLDRAFT_142999 [Phycomyces blakesleeanus NRRL 1555(-)]OAD76011.1 hypothetical protein PHYBLDRAFT_142999 [Phycomyces blakesleeanus NRRL 1555(-)]|eukprot:XP_018294051.1 hypothetical protein PHYBLDRAFT_142999 [Phycomyces blakesleeanus NRRL 1555(-)]
MLATQLPFEILFHIASFLPPKEKRIGSVVCRTWSQPFEESLWNPIDIKGNWQLWALCEKMSGSAESNRGYRQLIQELTLSAYSVSVAGICRLMEQRFPSIKSFCVEKDIWLCRYPPSVTDWRHWKSLKQLSFHIYGDKTTVPAFFSALSCLPALTQLKLTYDSFKDREPFCMDDLETLLTSTPHLKTLLLTAKMRDISQEDIARLRDLKPSNQLMCVSFEIPSWDLRWLYYWAIKAPNLSSLDWKLMKYPSDKKGHLDEATSLFGSLKNAFQKTECFKLNILDSPFSSHILDWLRHYDTPLKYLEYSTDGEADEPAIITDGKSERVLFSFGCLESIILRFINSSIELPVLLTTLGQCTLLVDLNLIAPELAIDIDSLLDSCRFLKKLQLDIKYLSVNPKISPNTIMHGLRFVELQNTSISSSFFGYLSERCRILRRLCLIRVAIQGTRQKSSGGLPIDMPFTHLDTLLMRSVELYALKSPSNFDRARMNLLSFIQLKDNDSTSNYRWQQTQLRDCCAPPPTRSPDWYHWYLSEETPSRPVFWKLNKSEARYTEGYFRSEWRMFMSVTSLLGGVRFWTPNVSKAYWKEDLLRGYAAIQIGSVEHFIIE